MEHGRTPAWRIALPLVLVGALLAGALLLPAAADPVQNVEELPRVAFVARNDVPFDSLSVGPIAGALGGIVVITSPTSLSEAARDALVDFGPDLVVIAGGNAAISPAVEAEIDAAGPWAVERKAGAGRDQTSAELATLLGDLEVDRPAIAGGRQIVGDVTIGGRLSVDELGVQSSTLVPNLNAGLLDGRSASAYRTLAYRTQLADSVDLTGHDAAANAVTVMELDNLSAGVYVIVGQASPSWDGGTIRSLVRCDVRDAEGTVLTRATVRVGSDPGYVGSGTMPLTAAVSLPDGSNVLRVACWASAVDGDPPVIFGGDHWTQFTAIRIGDIG